jgi:hypothetical protein
MPRMMRAIALLTLTLWGLGLVHCELERVTAIDLVQSCCVQTPSDCAPADPCEDDDCASVEDGKYRPEEQPLLVVWPVMAPEKWIDALECDPESDTTCNRFDWGPPPELSGCWHLLERAAPSPRAPSLHS